MDPRLWIAAQYVWPHLEFSTQAWAPWTEADTACLEKVQQRAGRQVSGLTSTSYEDRLLELGLPSLEERRHQADMCMVHRILQRNGGLKPETWFETSAEISSDWEWLRTGIKFLQKWKDWEKVRFLKEPTNSWELSSCTAPNGEERELAGRERDATRSRCSLRGPTWTMGDDFTSKQVSK